MDLIYGFDTDGRLYFGGVYDDWDEAMARYGTLGCRYPDMKWEMIPVYAMDRDENIYTPQPPKGQEND